MLGFKLFYLLFFAGLNILHAYHDSCRIKEGKRIYHGLNGLFHILIVIPIYLHLKDWFFIIGIFSLRRIVFDTTLNLFRGLRFDYISSTTTSIIDRLSYRFQSKAGYVYYYGIFFILIILSLIF